MKKRNNKTTSILIIEEVLDCIPAEITDLESYFAEEDIDITTTQAA